MSDHMSCLSSLVFLLTGLFSSPECVQAWEDHTVLRYIEVRNPLIQAENGLIHEHGIPEDLQRLLNHTHLVARAGGVITPLLGAEDTVAAGSHTQGPTAFGGIAINLPLTSVHERQELAAKRVAREISISQIRTQVLQNMLQLRQLEAELLAISARLQYLAEDEVWLLGREARGFNMTSEIRSGRSHMLEQRARKLQVEQEIISQRYRLAQFAGNDWGSLLAYLEGRQSLPG